MSIVRPPVHLAPGDYVDSRYFLFQDCSLRRTKLSVREVTGRKLARSDQAI